MLIAPRWHYLALRIDDISRELVWSVRKEVVHGRE
jgi:hypothetical protein